MNRQPSTSKELLMEHYITIVPSTVVVAQQQQQINSNTSSSQSTDSSSSPNPLSLKTIFKQVENSVIQIKSKIPTTGVPNPLNQSSNTTTLGSVTNGHVVGDAKVVDVTFVDDNRYTAKVIASDIYSDIAVLQTQNASQPQRQQHEVSNPFYFYSTLTSVERHVKVSLQFSTVS